MDVTTGKLESVDMISMGGQNVGDFGMTDSAEFFHVLSDTLYPNKALAVCREIFCNAWDAHVEAGRTDTPVEVTFTDDGEGNTTVAVKDHGLGIPHEKMVSIYCTYGGSTKKHMINATGGFGLGTKAPFAVSHVFFVENCYGGKKILYKAIREDSITGKPNLKNIWSEDTELTGITVSFTISSYETAKYKNLFSMLAFLGGMKLKTVNQYGEELHGTIDYSKQNEDFFLMLYSNALHSYAIEINAGGNNLWVKLGTVFYPVSLHSLSEEAQQEYNNIILPALKSTQFGKSQHIVVLKAEGGTLRVVPSREGLSYNQITIKTLNELVIKTSKRINDIYHRISAPLVARYKQEKDVAFRRNANCITHSSVDYGHNTRQIGSLLAMNAVRKLPIQRGYFNFHKDREAAWNKSNKRLYKILSNVDGLGKFTILPRSSYMPNKAVIIGYTKYAIDTAEVSRKEKIHEMKVLGALHTFTLSPTRVRTNKKLTPVLIKKLRRAFSEAGMHLVLADDSMKKPVTPRVKKAPVVKPETSTLYPLNCLAYSTLRPLRDNVKAESIEVKNTDLNDYYVFPVYKESGQDSYQLRANINQATLKALSSITGKPVYVMLAKEYSIQGKKYEEILRSANRLVEICQDMANEPAVADIFAFLVVSNGRFLDRPSEDFVKKFFTKFVGKPLAPSTYPFEKLREYAQFIRSNRYGYLGISLSIKEVEKASEDMIEKLHKLPWNAFHLVSSLSITRLDQTKTEELTYRMLCAAVSNYNKVFGNDPNI
jgi:hypothetical protein